jgi:hypothetical protein
MSLWRHRVGLRRPSHRPNETSRKPDEALHVVNKASGEPDEARHVLMEASGKPEETLPQA